MVGASVWWAAGSRDTEDPKTTRLLLNYWLPVQLDIHMRELRTSFILTLILILMGL